MDVVPYGEMEADTTGVLRLKMQPHDQDLTAWRPFTVAGFYRLMGLGFVKKIHEVKCIADLVPLLLSYDREQSDPLVLQ